MPRQTRQARQAVADLSQGASSSLLLTDLPEAVLCRIFSFLPLRTLAAVPSVSRACSQALVGQYSHLVWRRRLHKLEKRLRGENWMELEDGDWLHEHKSMPPYPGPPPHGLLPTTHWDEGPQDCRFHPETAQPQYLFHSAAEAPKQVHTSSGHCYPEIDPLAKYTPIWVGLDPPHHCTACGGLLFDTHDAFQDHCCNSAMHADLMRPPDKRLPVELRDPRFFDPPAWAALSDHQRFSSLYTYLQRVLKVLGAPLTAAYTHDPAAKAGRLNIQSMQDWVALNIEDRIADEPGMSRREQAKARARCSRKQVAEHMVYFAEQEFYEYGLIRDSLARDVCIGGYGEFGFSGSASRDNFLCLATGFLF